MQNILLSATIAVAVPVAVAMLVSKVSILDNFSLF